MTHPLVGRVAATQATLDEWKGRPFAWGSADCARMVISHLKRMGCPIKLAGAGDYDSALGARRALGRLGFKTLAEAMDASFLRIPPAAALVGDVLEMPGDDVLGALAVAVGNGRALSWHEDAEGTVVVQPVAMTAAWRVTSG